MWIVWAVVAVACAGLEVVTGSFFVIYFAVAAALVAAVSLTPLPLAAQVVLFAVLGAAGVAFTRPALLEAMRRQRPVLHTGVDAMRGKVGLLTQPISEFDPGQVRLGGETWTARSYYDGESIAAGTRVEVVEIRGVTAMVIPAPSPKQILPTPEG